MVKKVVNYTGESLRTTYDFAIKRDAEVARRVVAVLKDDYEFGGDIKREQLINPPTQEDRVVLFRETAALTNQEAANGGLIPQELADSPRLIMPDKASQKGLKFPFVGAFFPPTQLEAATKLSIHNVSPATEAPISPRLQAVQGFSKALKEAHISCVLEGWTAIDIPGADYAAQDLLSKGENGLIKYGRGSLGQDQWTITDDASYKDAMEKVDESMRRRGTKWQESGLVFERKLASHDQLVVGQLNIMGQLISWIGRMDHGPVRNARGEQEIIYTGSSKIYVLGSIENLANIFLPQEAIEDLAKAKQFGQIMEENVSGGVVTRVHYNLLRGRVETTITGSSEQQYVSGISEVTLRGGGGSGAETRAVRALSLDNNSPFKPAPKEDCAAVVKLNGIPVVIGLTKLEYFASGTKYRNAHPLSEDAEILYDGTDPTYGFVRIYTNLQEASDLLNDSESLKMFLYPNITAEALNHTRS